MTETEIKKTSFGLMGCGFLGSQLIPALLPFANTFVLVDNDRVEVENYDNALFPKGMTNARKVSAIANTIQMFSNAVIQPIHLRLKSVEDFTASVEFIFSTFDNLKSRKLVQDICRSKSITGINVGVTQNYAVIDWLDEMEFPTDPQEIAKIETRLAEIKDVCTRIEFRTLGVLASSYAVQSYYVWATTGIKTGYVIGITKQGTPIITPLNYGAEKK